MKILKRVKKKNGRIQLFIFGIKLFSYKKKRRIKPAPVYKILGNLLVDKTAEIKEGCVLQNGADNTIEIGKYVQLNPYTILYGGNIKIKDNCMIAPHVVITTANHDFVQTDIPMRFASCIGENDLTIEEDVWIGAHASIIAGTKIIGKGSVIGANSVVNRPVPPYAIVAGSPAKIIKYRTTEKMQEEMELSLYKEYEPQKAKEILKEIEEHN